jgi:hypothetical protein
MIAHLPYFPDEYHTILVEKVKDNKRQKKVAGK